MKIKRTNVKISSNGQCGFKFVQRNSQVLKIATKYETACFSNVRAIRCETKKDSGNKRESDVRRSIYMRFKCQNQQCCENLVPQH